ncbi:PH domain-containing protein [Candidatus Parcubacteria bacterium]|nr:PH domain-containing protein [Candidatus Parcubacteria bacterium]
MNESLSTITPGAYTRLGSKAYWFFLSQKAEAAASFLVLALVFTAARSMSAVPKQAAVFLGLAGVVCFIVFFAALIVAFISSLLVYKSHGYCLADDALKIKSGIWSQQEIAIPYRQIQTVDIERKLSERMMGLSRIVIVTAAEDNPATDHNEAEGVLPAMDDVMAHQLQEELLKRADVQKVFQVNKA